MATSQATRNKRRGADWELRLLEWIRNEGMKAERLRLAGKLDEGDIAIDHGDGDVTLIEAKDAKFEPGTFIGEAITEADNYANARKIDRDSVFPVVIVRRRGKPIEDAYVITTVKEFFA